MPRLLLVCPCVTEQSHQSTINSQEMERTHLLAQNRASEIFTPEDLQSSPASQERRTSVLGKIVLGFTGAVAVGLVAITTPFVTPALRKVCLPYVPATERQVANVLQMCRNGKGQTLVDLGSGDGRVVLAAARKGYNSHGIELNPWLVYFSRLQARLQGLHRSATFSRQDLWKVNLSKYDNVVIFGVSEMMPKLQVKVKEEMKEDAHVIACRFPFSSWQPRDNIQDGIDSVWLYKKHN